MPLLLCAQPYSANASPSYRTGDYPYSSRFLQKAHASSIILSRVDETLEYRKLDSLPIPSTNFAYASEPSRSSSITVRYIVCNKNIHHPSPPEKGRIIVKIPSEITSKELSLYLRDQTYLNPLFQERMCNFLLLLCLPKSKNVLERSVFEEN